MFSIVDFLNPKCEAKTTSGLPVRFGLVQSFLQVRRAGLSQTWCTITCTVPESGTVLKSQGSNPPASADHADAEALHALILAITARSCCCCSCCWWWWWSSSWLVVVVAIL